MSFSRLCYAVLLLSLLVTVFAKNQESKFAAKVRSILPEETFKKLFSTDHDSLEQFLRALTKAEKAEADVVGTSFPSSLNDDLEVDVKKYADMCTPESLFRVYVNSEGEVLKSKLVLTDDNLDDLADNFAKYLEKAAMSVQKENIEETGPAISTACFEFLKTKGLATAEVLKLFTKNILNEIKLEYS